MRLAGSLSQNVIEALRGGIFNRFKIKKRRDALFFEDILAEYIRECEKRGYGAEIEKNNYDSFVMLLDFLLPAWSRALPPSLIFNMLRKVWVNIGLIDDMRVRIDGNAVFFRMKNECITRIIGANRYSVGGIGGIVKCAFRCEARATGVKKVGNGEWEYSFELERKKYSPLKIKSEEEYELLNRVPKSYGVDLKKAISSGFFRIEQNRIFFRTLSLWHVESVFLHTLGNLGLCLDAVPKIAYAKFKGVVKKESTAEQKIVLMKNLFESMGWGIFKINYAGASRITVEISNPPYGLQAEPDNWTILLLTILGYLWTINKKLKLKNVFHGERLMRATYSA